MVTNEDSGRLSRVRFGRFAERYVSSRGHAQGADLERLLEIARPQPEWEVLDVATGGGHTALAFAPHVAHVVATDLTPQMLDAARAHIGRQGVDNVSFERADAQDLPFEEERFDLVTCRIAPHHFADCCRFVGEASRVLRPGGRLLVQDHVLPDDPEAAATVDAFERLRDPSHNRAYPEGEWIGMVEGAGLAVVHVEQVIKGHGFVDWCARQDCSPEVVAQLGAIVDGASPEVVEWMEPRSWGTPEATFVNHHLILVGVNDDAAS